jgi:shikimate kinase
MNWPASNIFLVGMMGAGKSTVGRNLARILKKDFVDLDCEIERKTGVKIPTIFEIEGESGFRQREHQSLTDVSVLSNLIIATGGGVVMTPENLLLLKKSGFVIYLRATSAELWKRIAHDRSRPLLQVKQPLQKLESLLQQRAPLYEEVADLVVNTAEQSVAVLCGRIADELNRLAEVPNSL